MRVKDVGPRLGKDVTCFRVKEGFTHIQVSTTWCNSYHPTLSTLPSTLLHTSHPPVFDRYATQLTRIYASQIHSSLFHPLLLSGVSGSGKSLVATAAASQLDINVMEVSCINLTGESSGNMEGKIKQILHKSSSLSPILLHLSDVDALARNYNDRNRAIDKRVWNYFTQQVRELNEGKEFPVLLLFSSRNINDVTEDVMTMCLHHIHIQPLTPKDREVLLHHLLPHHLVDEQLVDETTTCHLSALMKMSSLACYKRYGRICGVYPNLTEEEEKSIISSSSSISPRSPHLLTSSSSLSPRPPDLHLALQDMDDEVGDAVGRPQIPQVSWEDIGGLDEVKREILDTINLPLQHPHLIDMGISRCGILLYGPPGTGKTLLAKAVATQCQLNFISVKGPELINKYVGQSEENIREVFSKAHEASPCVVFFDELDSLAPSRGKSGDSGGVIDRVVSQLLAELDGLSESGRIFIIGATNRPDLLDPALLRPGRFDKLVYVGVSDDMTSRLQIITALTRKLTLSSRTDLRELVSHCPPTFTGADYYALCSDATLAAIKRIISHHSNNDDDDDIKLVLEREDFLKVLPNIKPSVTEEELEKYYKINR